MDKRDDVEKSAEERMAADIAKVGLIQADNRKSPAQRPFILTIPDTLTVGGHLIKVFKDYKFRERSDICGHADLNLNELRLSYNDVNGNMQSDSVIAVNFIHEMLHFIARSYLAKENMDERLIDGFAQGLYQVLKDMGIEVRP